MDFLKEANQLLEKFETTAVADRWHMPFPMGVFGTLRERHWNNRLMHRSEIGAHFKAFMPHFIAKGLTISFSEGASAPFEIFCYKSSDWKKMIPSVDSLEGFRSGDFCAEDAFKLKSYGYFRTLAWLHVLPDDFSHKLFEESYLSGSRNLEIPQNTWENYPKVPCWVYSSVTQNEAAKGCGTVIWG